MKLSKLTLLSVICGVFFGVSAMAVAAPNPEAFQTEKDFHVGNIQERLQIMQTHLSCVQASQDHAAMKACHDATKQAQDVLEAKIKSHRADKKAQRQENKNK